MRYIGVLIWLSGACRLFKDGHGFGFVFRWYHPITWILLVILTPVCGIIGEKVTDIIPLKLSKFWKENIDQMQYVTPFTKLSTLVPFKHKIAKL